MDKFSGSKGVLLHKDNIVCILRDDISTIPFPNMWDLPGGGREGNETPFECLARETSEELGIILSSSQIIWTKIYPSVLNTPNGTYRTFNFFVIEITKDQLSQIKLGDEGQRWELQSIRKFAEHSNAVTYQQERVKDYLKSLDRD